MNFDDFIEYLERVEARIKSSLVTHVEVVANDASALIKQRVVQRGVDANGSAFSAYSVEKAPAFFYVGKGRRQSANNYAKKAVASRVGISYEEWRRLNGLNTNIKNFEFTGTMWRGVGVVEVSRLGGTVTAKIGGKTALSAERLGWVTEREGKDILALSAVELRMLAQTLKSRVQKILNDE